MREGDRRATEESGIPGILLMENAGFQAARAARELLPLPRARPVAIVCGTGNNGGDGLVLARHLAALGAKVTVYLAGKAGRIAGAARTMLEAWQGRGGTCLEELPASLEGYALVVDAVVGTGSSGALRSPAKEAVELINRASCPVLSLDLPSGVDADTGAVAGPAVRASMTVTFAALKPGLLFFPGAGLAGRVVVAGISLPSTALSGVTTQVTTASLARQLLPPRRPDAHKGSHGRVLVIGGSSGLTGAAALAATAALRAGAGLVTVATPARLQGVMACKLTEAMTFPLPDTAEGTVCAEAVTVALERARGASAVVLGPGLGQGAGPREFARAFSCRCPAPLVVDADALSMVEPEVDRDSPLILTPHPGEASRLLQCEVAEIAADRLLAARELAARYRAVVVLKGARTVVTAPGSGAFIDPTANPALATGGTGDVLAGAIGALLAQGCPPLEAAVAGVYLHGVSGGLASRELGDAGVLAQEVAEALPRARRAVLEAPGECPWLWDSACLFG
jgi:NAD(P)H-hydrate epimerase